MHIQDIHTCLINIANTLLYVFHSNKIAWYTNKPVFFCRKHMLLNLHCIIQSLAKIKVNPHVCGFHSTLYLMMLNGFQLIWLIIRANMSKACTQPAPISQCGSCTHKILFSDATWWRNAYGPTSVTSTQLLFSPVYISVRNETVSFSYKFLYYRKHKNTCCNMLLMLRNWLNFTRLIVTT